MILSVLAVIGAGGVAWAVFKPSLGATPFSTETQPAKPSPKPTVAQRGAARTTMAADVEKCRTASQKGLEAVSAARPAVAGWAAHIQAMKDQESGKNTEAQTKAIWTATRAAGPAQVAKLQAAEAAYESARTACDAVADGELNSEDRAAVKGCRDFDAKVDTTLDAANRAIAEWKAHLAAMAARRAGQLDPDTAMIKWMSAYEKAPFRIGVFQRAEREYRDATPTCDVH